MAKKSKGKLGHNANYDFKERAPAKPMGNGSFSNLPTEPMFMPLSGKWNMRDGIRNSPVTSIDRYSRVDENMREDDGND